jgi:MFS family permease
MITISLVGIFLSGGSWALLFVLVGIMGAFYGATFPIYGACAGDYFPKEIMGTVIGAWTPFYGLGAVLVHWISGILRDATGIYDHPFLINILMGCLGVFFMCLVREKN